jgi:hypothetical protein
MPSLPVDIDHLSLLGFGAFHIRDFAQQMRRNIPLLPRFGDQRYRLLIERDIYLYFSSIRKSGS